MDPAEAIEDAVRTGLLPADGCLLLAVSGGLDSVVMAHVLSTARFDWSLVIATVEHGLHPQSKRHGDAVEQMAQALDVPFHRLRADIDRITQGEGIEAGARAERYRLLTELAHELDADALVTAHTLDDQAETFLMRAAVGAGVSGLRGIPWENGLRRRPFLGVSRNAIEAYGTTHQLTHCIDPTNSDERYRRNAVRRRIVPEMAAVFGESWVRCAARTADNLATVEVALEQLLQPVLERLVAYGPSGLRIDRGELIVLGDAIQRVFWVQLMTHECPRRYPGFCRVGEQQMSALASLAASGHEGQSRDLGGGWFARIEGGSLWMRPCRTTSGHAPPQTMVIDGPGRYQFGNWCIVVSEAFRNNDEHPVRQHVLPVNRAPFPWTVRRPHTGERFHPIGAPGGKRISRLWIDRKVPAAWRVDAPLIEVAGKAVFLAGVRAADDMLVEPGNTVLHLCCFHRTVDLKSAE